MHIKTVVVRNWPTGHQMFPIILLEPQKDTITFFYSSYMCTCMLIGYTAGDRIQGFCTMNGRKHNGKQKPQLGCTNSCCFNQGTVAVSIKGHNSAWYKQKVSFSSVIKLIKLHFVSIYKHLTYHFHYSTRLQLFKWNTIHISFYHNHNKQC